MRNRRNSVIKGEKRNENVCNHKMKRRLGNAWYHTEHANYMPASGLEY